METFTQLRTNFTKNEIEEIYNYLVEYSIINYEKHPLDILKRRYENALNIIKDKQIDKSFEELEEYLLNKQEKYLEVIKSNKDLINCVARSIIHILNEDIKRLTTNEEKLSYIFDFVTKVMIYNKDYEKYLFDIPPTNGITFNFNKTIPNDNEIFTSLVLKEVLNDEICNLICYLSKIWNIPVGKMYVNYKGKRHAINYYIIKGEISLIDATRKILNKDEKKHKCFLTSANKLNRNNDYIFDNTDILETFTIGEEYYEYKNVNINNTVQHIKRISPKIKFQKESQQIKTKSIK